jgi:hypothetical protein
MNLVLVVLISAVGFFAAVKGEAIRCQRPMYSSGMGGKAEGTLRYCAKSSKDPYMYYVDACVPASYTCDIPVDFQGYGAFCTLKETEPWRTDLPSFDIARDPKECHTGNVTDYNGYKICTGRHQGEGCSTDKDCNAGSF